MNRGIYSTATGMVAGQQWMDVITNNLANASTNGFKRDGLAFNDALVREMSDGKQSIGSLGAGSAVKNEYTVFAQGPIQETKNPLDVAINDEKGLFAVEVETANGPQTLYTRDGAFTLNEDRELVTKTGHKVLDDQGQPIQLPNGQITIGENGAVKVDDAIVAQLGIFDGNFTKVGGNLYQGANATVIDEPRVVGGAIEGSNVNAIESMAQMITISRAFELAQKSINQQDELTQRLIQSQSRRRVRMPRFWRS